MNYMLEHGMRAVFCGIAMTCFVSAFLLAFRLLCIESRRGYLDGDNRLVYAYYAFVAGIGTFFAFLAFA